MKAKLNLAAALVLIAGLLSGAAIYLSADDGGTPSAYTIVGDQVFAYDPTTSKTYMRQIERFGGKMSLLFDDVNRWFWSLWEGRRLGITVAAFSAFVAGLLFLIARRY